MKFLGSLMFLLKGNRGVDLGEMGGERRLGGVESGVKLKLGRHKI